jgi:prevent-host-death family protein
MTVQVSVSDAKGQLTELVRRAEAGEEVILTRHGQPTVRLAAIARTPSGRDKRTLMEALRRSVADRALPGPDAARSQDGLYDDHGLPG